MNARADEEYRSLRATIKDRGTARVWVFVVGLAAWGGLLVSVWRPDRPAWGVLVALLVLAGTFEGVLSLHTGVERVGRYLQVFHEARDPGWEHHVMHLGRAGAPAFGGDALFTPLFLPAIALTFVAGATSSPAPAELIVLAGVHMAAFGRVLDARRRSAAQRDADLRAFERLRSTGD